MTGPDLAVAATAPRTGRAEIAAALPTVYVPLAVGLCFGLLLGGNTKHVVGYSAWQLFTHNVAVGAFTTITGMLTFGFLALVAGCFGGFVNGYGLGVVAVNDGLAELVGGLPHFLPETAASVCFTAVGLAPATRILRRWVLDRPVEPLRVAARRWVLFLGFGVALLVAAALLEATTA